MPGSVTVRAVVDLLERRYPPDLASEWDAVGLVCGDPDASVSRILFAVDPVRAVVDEALLLQADLIVTHHPLLFKPLKRLVPTDFVSGLAYRLAQSGIAYYAIHTNLDAAPLRSEADSPVSSRYFQKSPRSQFALALKSSMSPRRSSIFRASSAWMCSRLNCAKDAASNSSAFALV